MPRYDRNRFEKEISQFQDDLTNREKQYLSDFLDEWMYSYDDAEFLGVRKNKLDTIYICLYHNDMIYAIGGNSSTIMYAPRMSLRRNDDELVIEDVICRNNSSGNGTILMNALFEYVKLHNIKKVSGELSPVDADHRKRQEKYYSKFGFIITPRSITKYF